MYLLSVVLCTRNRARQLHAALAAYRALDADENWELVVVDNASEDATARVLEEFATSSSISLRVVREPRPGLARARNRGLAESRGQIVAYTDDDCYPAADYLNVLRAVFENPSYDYVGGRVLLHDARNARIAVQEQTVAFDLAPYGFVAAGQILGANMAFRRTPLLELRGFDERLGAGTLFRSGEDTDLFRRAARAGRRGRYAPELIVRHHHGRSSDDARKLRRAYRRGVGAGMAKFVVDEHSRELYLRHWLWALRGAGVIEGVGQLLWALLFVVKHGPSARRLWQHPAGPIEALLERATTRGIHPCV